MVLLKYMCPECGKYSYTEQGDERIRIDCDYCSSISAYYVGEESFEDDE